MTTATDIFLKNKYFYIYSLSSIHNPVTNMNISYNKSVETTAKRKDDDVKKRLCCILKKKLTYIR